VIGDDARAVEQARGGRAIRYSVVVALCALSLLPVGTWLNISFQRALSFHAVGWDVGTVLVLLLAAAVAVVLSADDRASALARPIHALISTWERRPVVGTAILASLATVLYGITAWTMFDAKPLLIDEVVQVLQARIFASGQLWLPLDAHPEFRSIMHMVEQGGRWYGQFPPGGPAMLTLGELVHAPWLVNPVCGGATVAAFASALRWSGVRPGVSLGASIVLGFAPFVVFQSGSHMNHVTSLTWLLVASAALVRATYSTMDRPLAGLVCGLGFGLAATIRPLDAAAWALPASVWLAWRAVRVGHWRAFFLSGVGVAVPMAIMMYVNARTTGGPLTFGYTVLWGQSHGLGFHPSPWGESHTMGRGLALTAAYLNRLNEYLFEVPVPSLLPALASLALARRSGAFERYMLAAAGLVLGAYFAYWHDGFFLGPRFMFPLVPVVALLVAELPGIVAGRWPHPLAVRGVAAAYTAAILLGVTMVLPSRVRSYPGGFQSMRWDYDALASRAGAARSVILVRESWGAQVIDRLWALGVSRSLTEVLYRHVDTCGLDDMAGQLESAGVRGAAAEARLRPMIADSARVVESTMSPDATERVLPGSVYPQQCAQRILEDRGGYTLFAPLLLARDTSIRWIRDLHARDTLVVSLSDQRPVFVLRKGTGADEWTPVFVRVDGDSLRAAWGRHEPTPSKDAAPKK
jgi:hypothetical protein